MKMTITFEKIATCLFWFFFAMTFGGWLSAALLWSEHLAYFGLVSAAGMGVSAILWAVFRETDQ